MLFKVVSILVACTTSQATAPGRSVRNLGKAEDELKKLEGKLPSIDFHASTFESKINAEKFGLKLKYPIGKWLGKGITMLSVGFLLGGLFCGLYVQSSLIVEELKRWWNNLADHFVGLERFLVYSGFMSLLFTNAYGYWRVEKARKAYLVMSGFDAVAVILYVTFVTGNLIGRFLADWKIVNILVSIAAQLFLAVVFLFNWYKVLYPAWTGFGDW